MWHRRGGRVCPDSSKGAAGRLVDVAVGAAVLTGGEVNVIPAAGTGAR
jgi:hypothetical protein